MVLEAKRSNKSDSSKKSAPTPSPVSNIGIIGSLKKFPEKEYAKDILHQIAKAVAPIIHENNFKVGTLCEMYPKNPTLLGLNVNRGQKILIRLRSPTNERLFYPIGDLIVTFLHELTHNIYGPHDDKFYKFLDGLKKRFDELQSGGSVSGYVCEEERLGSGYNALGIYVSIREKRIKELSKPKITMESRKLGSLGGVEKVRDMRSVRQKLLEAAERRQRDAKWCPSNVDVEEVEPNNEEIDLEVVDGPEEKQSTSKTEGKRLTTTSKGLTGTTETKKSFLSHYKEVIDLTSDDYNEPMIVDSEIIVIDGCETQNKEKEVKSLPKSILRNSISELSDSNEEGVTKEPRRVQFSGLLPSFDEEKDSSQIESDTKEDDIQYTVSSSPRTFFGNEDRYPRRKLVAALNFDQILKKGELISLHESKESLFDPILHDRIESSEDSSGPKKKANTSLLNPKKKKTERKRVETKRIETKRTEIKRTEIKRTESKRTETKRTETKRTPRSKKTKAQQTAPPRMKKTVKSISFDQLL